MARFDRMRYDYRGPEFSRSYGRYEGAFARRIARQRWELENAHRNGRRPFEASPSIDEEPTLDDIAYSRRYWPPALRRSHRMY